MESKQPALSLPVLVTTPGDIKRLARELKVLDEYMRQQALRTPGQPMAKLPKTSRLLDELAAANDLNLLDEAARHQLTAFLTVTEGYAPVVHISFAVDPSSAFLQKIVGWFRQNIHPLVLVRVGLQPSIAAGCTVRTTNKYFDFGLGMRFKQRRDELMKVLQ
jgi:F0F1-type ATP synthase delta subunit